MNKKQNNYVAMNRAVNSVFDKYTEQVQSIEALEREVNNFKTNLADIKSTVMIQEGKITGSAEQKQKEENEMIEATVRIAAVVYVYAIDNSDFELADKVNVSEYGLKRLNQSKLQATCQNILKIAMDLVSELSGYGTSQEEVTRLQEEINEYVAVMATPRTKIVTRAEATGRLKELISKQSALFSNKLDKLMLVFKSKDSVFYNEYKGARIIVNMGVRHVADEDEEII